MRAAAGVWSIFALAGFFGISDGFIGLQAFGQGVSADNAAQLDSGFGQVLTTGTLRYSNGQTATGLAQLGYSGQAPSAWVPMVQGASLSSFSNRVIDANRLVAPAPEAGFTWAQSSGAGNQGSGSFVAPRVVYRSVSGPMPLSYGTGDDFLPSDAIVSALPATSCLDLSVGCGFLGASAPVPTPVSHGSARRSTAGNVATKKPAGGYGKPSDSAVPKSKTKAKKGLGITP